MEILLDNLGKRFTNYWVFKDLNHSIQQGQHLAVLGPNGSGKSTLLKIICGALAPSQGKVIHHCEGKAVDESELYRLVSYAAPYAELIEDFTLLECFRFHKYFKPFLQDISETQFLDLLKYPFKPELQIKYYSSGMKQRLKLGLGICSKSALLILDEPGSNLDEDGKAWFQTLLNEFGRDRTIIIASNEKEDTLYCNSKLDLTDFSS